MAFPQDLLTIQTQICLGAGVWQDISDDVYARDDGVLTITRGRPDEASTFDPASLEFDLNNRSGRYSPRNPLSPYYGQIGRNTPIRVSVLTGSPYLATQGLTGDYVSTPDATALHITGDLDVRVDAELVNWGADGSQIALAGRWDTTAGLSWVLSTLAGMLVLTWTQDGTLGTAWEAPSTVAPTIPPGGRLAVRATLDVDNGASGSAVTFYTAPTSAGPWTQLGAPVINTPTTSVYAGSAPLVVGAAAGASDSVPAHGSVYGVQVLSGIGGTAVASPDFTAQAPGATGFTDAAGRAWTLHGTTEITNRDVRFVGEVTSWPNRWTSGGMDAYVPIEAAGITRRLGQGTQPQLQTPLRRAITLTPGLVEYWPLEDDADSAMAASAAPSGRGITPTGVTYAADSTLPGSAAVPTIAAGGHLTAAVRPYATTASAPWAAEMLLRLPATLPSSLTLLAQASISGMITIGAPVATVQVLVSTTVVRLLLADADGNTLASADDPLAADIATLTSGWIRLALGCDSTEWVAIWGAIGTEPHFLFVGLPTVVGTGAVTQVTTGTVAAPFGGMSIGHLAVVATAPQTLDATTYLGADIGWQGETAGARLVRIAAEEGIPVELTGRTARDMTMGVQQPATLLDTWQACADADGGLLYEPRDVIGLAYRDRHSLYNQTPTLIAYHQLVPPLEPTDDDQRTINDVTVQRQGGVSARAVQTTGRLSTLPPPAGVGTYPATPTLLLADDTQPAQVAGWLLHLGTVDEQRYPVVTVYLQRNPELLAAVAAVDVGSRIQVTGAPLGLLPPGPIDQLVEGYTETLAQYRWEFQLECGPASPWDTGMLDTGVYGRADTDGSQLAAGATATATTLSVVVTAGPLWQVSDGQLTANPSVEVDLSGWTVSGGTMARVPTPAGAPFAGAWSIQLTPSGVASTAFLRSPHAAVTPGQAYYVHGWLQCALAASASLSFNWFDSSGAFLSSSAVTRSLVAGQWLEVADASAVAPASAATVTVTPTLTGTPSAAAVLLADVLYVADRPGCGAADFPFDVRVGGEQVTVTGCTGTGPQTMTVIRSVNGVVKAQNAGADVRLAYPTIVAL